MKNKEIKIGYITTSNHNIGDDFIREGISDLLTSLIGRKHIEHFPINKHKPLTIYPQLLIRAISNTTAEVFKNAPHLESSIYRRLGKIIPANLNSHFDDCDMVVQCGTPVFWEGCDKSEWAEIIWQKVIKKLSKLIPVMNVAAGSSYPWERKPDSISDLKDSSFIAEILSYCILTTTRDTLAEKIVAFFGRESKCLPCTAFLIGKNYFLPSIEKDIFIINYMPGGGHHGYNQEIVPLTWELTIKSVLQGLIKRHSVLFLCHNHLEVMAAKNIAPSVPRVLPKSIGEYFSIASRAKGALCNRMHASVALAGIGVPSIAVGTDSRLLMVDRLGLPNYYVKDITHAILEPALEKIISSKNYEKDRLLSLQDDTVLAYRSLLSPIIDNIGNIS